MNIQPIKYNCLRKCFPIIKIIVCTVFAALIMTACSGEDDPRNSGKKADEELLEEIYQELLEQKQPIYAEEGDVFWSPGGSIWHEDAECSSLARSKTILHGTVEEALTAGKERACLKCSGTAEIAPDDEIEEGDVFFTPNGATWHKSADCTYLARSENILHASVDEALEAGKERPCSKCYPEDSSENNDGNGNVSDEENNEISDAEVFWTELGSRWHANIDCYYIADSDNVESGSVADALTAGKKRACSKCFSDEEDKDENEDVNVEDNIENSDTEVFWTEIGNRWHTHRDCYHIADLDDVKSGTVAEAIEDEKTGLCLHCKKSDKE